MKRRVSILRRRNFLFYEIFSQILFFLLTVFTLSREEGREKRRERERGVTEKRKERRENNVLPSKRKP